MKSKLVTPPDGSRVAHSDRDFRPSQPVADAVDRFDVDRILGDSSFSDIFFASFLT